MHVHSSLGLAWSLSRSLARSLSLGGCARCVPGPSLALPGLRSVLLGRCPVTVPFTVQSLPGLIPATARSQSGLCPVNGSSERLQATGRHSGQPALTRARAHTHMHTHRSSLLVKVGKLEEAATIHRLVCEYDPLHTNKVCLCLTLHVVYWSNSARGLLV